MKKIMFFLMAALFTFSAAFAQQRTAPSFSKMLAPVEPIQMNFQNDGPSKAPGDVIFSNGFEGTTGGTTSAAGSLPTGWVSSPTSGTLGTARWGTTASAMVGINGSPGPNSGTRFAYIAYTSTAHDAWMITPAFTLTAGTTYKIEFYTIMLGYDWYEELEVKIGTAATVAGMTTFLWENKTEDIGSWTKISITYTPTTSGSHYLGFHSTSEDQLYTAIDDISVSEAPAHDMAISANFPYTQIPTMLPLTLTAKATNAGIQTQTNVKLAATLNGTSLGTSATGVTVAPGETATLTLPTSATPAAAANTLTYTVSQAEGDQVPGNNSATFNFTGSTSVYAVDNAPLTSTGIGSNSNALTFGNIFEISTAQTLSQVIVGFTATATSLNYTLSLYKMTGDLVASSTDLLSGFAAVRTPGLNLINIPPVALEAGSRYFLCVNQLDANNVGVIYESIGGKILYVLNPDYTIYTGNSGYAAAVRMVLQVPNCAATAPTNLMVIPGNGQATFYWSGTTPHSFMLTLNNGTTETKYFTYNNTMTITGLSGNYTWSVAAMCDGVNGASATGNPFTVTVANCGDQTSPWYYGFEDGIHDNSNIPCFTQESVSGSNLWTVNQTYTDYSRPPRTGLKNAFLRYGNTRWLFREVYLQPGDYTFGLWARQDGTTASNASITLKYGTTATAAGMTENIAPLTGIVSGNYQQIKGNFTISTAGTYYLGILGTINSSPWYISIDDISLEKAVDVDMRAMSITGNLTPMATVSENYSVTVKNNGALPASNYKVSILSYSGEELASEIVTTPLAPQAEYTATLPVTFTQLQVGTAMLRGVVTLAGDQAPVNNEVSVLVNVMPHPGYNLVCNPTNPLGTGTGTNTESQQSYPISTYYYYSYSQQLYTAAEIALGAGTISSVSFQYSAGTLNRTNQTVYLYNTSQTSVTSWVPVGSMTPVYTGAISIAPGWVTINFTTPFEYTGGNLIVAVYHGQGSGYVSGGKVNVTTAANSTLYYANDTQFTSAAPPAGTSTNLRVNARFNICSKLYTLHPLNYGDPMIELIPNPVADGQTAVVNFYPEDDCHYITDILMNGESIGAVSSWNNGGAPITGVLPYFEVITAAYQYTITTSVNPAGNFGTITPTADYDCGSNVVITMTPNPGYKVGEIKINGSPIPNPFNKYTFTNLHGNHTIEVTFVECPFTIYFVQEGNGTIYQQFTNGDSNEITGGSIGVDYGMNHFTFVPDANYTLQAVYIDNVYNLGATTSGSYIFTNVTSNHTIKVIFKKVENIIVATAGPNGIITPSGNVSVPYGEDKEFTFTPNQGYVIDQVLVDGVNEAVAGSYTFENVVGAHTIFVSFKKETMYVTANANGCGSLSPNGVVAIPYNGNQIFTFAPNDGCKVIGVYVDGVSYPNAIPTGSYTFYYVDDQPHSLEVVFDKKTYPITASISDHGVINDVGATYVEHGDPKTYNFYAMPGYEITNVYVDGLNKPAAINSGNQSGEWTFPSVKEPHTISVIIKARVYTITAEATTGGYITPAGNIPVTYQGSQAFTFKALPGYEIDKVLVDDLENTEAAENGAYAFVNVSEDGHSIMVSFKVSRYQIKSSVGLGGNIAPLGTTEVTYFDNITYTITPEQDYKISYVMIDGKDMGAIETFTYSQVEANSDIQAFFFYDPTPVSINDQTIDDISIFSHTNVVYIVNEKNLPINDVTIFDMYGRIVWQGVPQGHTITLNVANGIYAVRVTSEDNYTVTKVSILR